MSEEQQKSPSEQAYDLQAKWNPPPEDKGFERVVGIEREPGDTRATAHKPMDELENSPTSSKRDAQRMDLYRDDGADEEEPEDVSDLKGKALDRALERRGLPKSGSAEEKRDRIREHDADDEEDDGGNA